MKRRNRNWILIVTVVMITMILGVTAGAFAETKKCTVSVNNPYITKGETLTVSLDIDDTDANDSVFIYYREPGSAKTKSVSLSYNTLKQKFEGTLDINDYFVSGKWIIQWVSVMENGSSRETFYNTNCTYEYTPSSGMIDLSSGDFTVYDTKGDSTAPAISTDTVSVLPKIATIEDTVQISMNISDDFSGIDYAYVSYQKPISKKEQTIWLGGPNLQTEKYEGNLTVSNDTESGEWIIDHIYVCDQAGNSILYYNVNCERSYTPTNCEIVDLSAGNFTVTGTDAHVDLDVPVIDVSTITLSKKCATVGDKIEFSVKILDESGVDSASINFSFSDNSSQYKHYELAYNSENGLFEVEIPIDQYFITGKWTLENIFASDKVWNFASIYNLNAIGPENQADLSLGDFEIYGTYTIPRAVEGLLYTGEAQCLVLHGSPIDENHYFVYQLGDQLSWEQDYNRICAIKVGSYVIYWQYMEKQITGNWKSVNEGNFTTLIGHAISETVDYGYVRLTEISQLELVKNQQIDHSTWFEEHAPAGDIPTDSTIVYAYNSQDDYYAVTYLKEYENVRYWGRSGSGAPLQYLIEEIDAGKDVYLVYELNDPSGIKGDINQDGTLDILDARLAKRIAMKDPDVIGEYTDAGFTAGDLDGNGKITINEVRKIKRAVLGEVTLN